MTITTNLYLPRLRAHALSAAVGAGKTRAAIAWLCSPSCATRNVLYVAPTQALIDQTARDLRRSLAATPGHQVRNVNLVHRENSTGSVQVEALSSINQVEGDEGHVQIITTVTFLAIVSRIARPELWSVILDEAFDPATFTTFPLGDDVLKGWAHFSELFQVDQAEDRRQDAEPGIIDALALEVAAALETIEPDRLKVGSKTLKAMVEALRHKSILITKGSDCEVQIPSQTWTLAVSQACSSGRQWQRHGQSLHRVTAELYGFPSIDGRPPIGA